MTQWMLGPDGWTMPVSEVATEVGGSFHYEWEPDDVDADGTLLTIVITYPSAEVLDVVLDTGMVDGMEASYARLEAVLG